MDSQGNVWVANESGKLSYGITELSEAGNTLSPPGGFAGGGLAAPYDVAVDAGGDVWIANASGDDVTELSSNGTALSPPARVGTGGAGR